MSAIGFPDAPRFSLGFLSFSGYLHPGASAKGALRDGIALFQHAERIGLDGGWLRVRHFERGLTGVFPFLGAVAQATSSLRIGTAVVPIAHDDGVRLAEDAATVDLLSDERLELGLSSGFATAGSPLATAFATARGLDPDTDVDERAQDVLRTFLAGIRGEELAPTSDDFRLQFTHAGEGLRVYPHSPTLAERIWYGVGSIRSTQRTARAGLNLQLSTINTPTAAPSGRTVPEEQAELVRHYRDTLAAYAAGTAGGRPREVSISRYVVPYSTPREREVFLAASERHIPGVSERFGEGWKFGSVQQIIDQLSTDEALVEARRDFSTTLLLNVPSTLDQDWTERLIELVATEIAPVLGWSPTVAVRA